METESDFDFEIEIYASLLPQLMAKSRTTLSFCVHTIH